MKPFAIWLAIVAVVFGAYALVTVAMRDTTRVFVYVDVSQPMQPVWSQARRELDRRDDRDHAEFALAIGRRNTNDLVHSWQSSLRLPASTQPFAPCDLSGVESFPEAADADERILVTVAASTCLTDDLRATLTDWTIVELG